MPDTVTTQANFTAGEISPRVRGRTDIARYKNGTQVLENFLPMRQGGIVRRPGFRFVAEVKDSTKLTRLIPFEFNDEQTYVLEFGEKASASFTVAAADASANTFTIATDVTGTFRATRTFTVSGSTANDGTYAVLTSSYDGSTNTTIFVTSVTDGTNDGNIIADIGYIRFYRDETQLESSTDVPTEIDSPYDAGDLANVKFAQSNDIIFFAHPDYHPFKLSRTSGDDTQVATWTMDEELIGDGPYLDENVTTTVITASASTGSINLTITIGSGFWLETDVGRSVRVRNGATLAGWAVITSITTTLIAVATVQVTDVGDTIPTTASLTTWSLGAFSNTTGWPAVVSFFDGRLWWAATASEISTLFASSLDNREDYRPTARVTTAGTVADSDGIVAQISDSQQNPVRWLFSDQRGMIVMASQGLHLLTNNANGDVISGATLGLSLRKQNNDSVSTLVSPQRSGTMILAPEKGERRTLQQVFTFQDERIIGTDLNLLADHVTVGGAVASAVQDRPDRRFWLARSDGQLLCLLYDPEQAVVAWSRHILGGNTPVVESIVTINEANEDQLWAITKRAVAGGTKRYVEFMEQTFDVADKLEDAFYVDSGLTLNDNKSITGASNSNPVTITALAHGFSDGDAVRIRKVKGLTLTTVNDDDSVTVEDVINDVTFTIGNVQTDTFNLLTLDGTTLDGYISAGDANKEVTSISGLSHLAGETVNAMVDGAKSVPLLVASDGTVTLAKAGSLVHIGLPIVSLMRTMPVVDTIADRDSRSGLMQIHKVFLLVDRSLGGAIGTQEGEYNELIYREPIDPMGEALPLFTGYIEGDF